MAMAVLQPLALEGTVALVEQVQSRLWQATPAVTAAWVEPLEMAEFQALAAMVVQAVLAWRAVSVSREHRVVPVALAVPRRMARPVTAVTAEQVVLVTTAAMLRQVSQLRRAPQVVTVGEVV